MYSKATAQMGMKTMLRLYFLLTVYMSNSAVLKDIEESSILSDCCNTSQTDLLQCTANALSEYSSISPSRVALVTYITPDLSYVSYSMAINGAYAQLHNYDFRIKTPETLSEFDRMDQRWNKVMILLNAIGGTERHLFNGWAGDSEYVVWMDADLVVVDFEFRFENIIAAHPEKDILISEDPQPDEIFSIANTGCVIVRNSQWSRAFLHAWWGTEASRLGVWDQHVFTQLLLHSGGDSPLGDVKSHIQLLPPDAINTKRPAINFHLPHNPILHMVGSVSAHRRAVFSLGLQALCDLRTGQTTALPRQLGLTREVLLTVEKSILASKGGAARELLMSLQNLSNTDTATKGTGQGAEVGWCVNPERVSQLNKQLNDILKLGNAREGPDREVVIQCLELLLHSLLKSIWCHDAAQDLLLSAAERLELMRHMQWAIDAAFQIAMENSADNVRRVMSQLEALLPRLTALAADMYHTSSKSDLYSRTTPIYYSMKRHEFLANSYSNRDDASKDSSSVMTSLVHLYAALGAWREMKDMLEGQQPRALDEGISLFFRIGLTECIHESELKGMRALKEGIDTLEMYWRSDDRSPHLMPTHMRTALASAYRNLAACIFKRDRTRLELTELFDSLGEATARGQFASEVDIQNNININLETMFRKHNEDVLTSTTDGGRMDEHVARRRKKYSRRKTKIDGF